MYIDQREPGLNKIVDKTKTIPSDNLEKLLLDNDFELFSYYSTNKKYIKYINESQNLYVRIYSDVNRIVEVQYESVSDNDFIPSGIVTLDTVDTIKKLKLLLQALK